MYICVATVFSVVLAVAWLSYIMRTHKSARLTSFARLLEKLANLVFDVLYVVVRR